MKTQETQTKKESMTFASSKSLLGRGDLRRTLGHQSNTLRGARAHLSYSLGLLSILWWEKGDWRGMGIRKNAKEDWGKVLHIIRKVTGVGSQPYTLFFSGSCIKSSHVCIVFVQYFVEYCFQYSSTLHPQKDSHL
jgi:hypothetical protein